MTIAGRPEWAKQGYLTKQEAWAGVLDVLSEVSMGDSPWGEVHIFIYKLEWGEWYAHAVLEEGKGEQQAQVAA